MSTARTLPYLTPSSDHVKASRWRLVLDNQDLLVGDALPDWDAGSTLRFLQRIKVQTASVYEQCRLPLDARLRLAVTWECTGTTLRGCGGRYDIDGSQGEWDMNLELKLPGHLLSERLHLKTVLTMVHIPERMPLRPWRPGSILWENQVTVLLEGNAARFPTELMDFQESGWNYPARAAWRLEWDVEQLDLPFMGSVRLYLNSRHPAIQRAVSHPREMASTLVISTIQYAVGRSMILGALNNDEFCDPDHDYDEYSTGDTLRRLVRTLFADQGLTSLRSQARENPDFFDSRLQEVLAIFAEG